MANNDDDGFFSDHDLDALPVTALEELEQKAVSSTQHADYERQPSSDYGNLDDEALEAVLLDTEDPPAIFNDAEILLENKVVKGLTQKEKWRKERYNLAQTHHNHVGQQKGGPNLQAHCQQVPLVAEDSGRHDVDRSTRTGRHTSISEIVDQPMEGQVREVNELQAKIVELLREQDTLQKTVKEAQATLLAKNGEVAILRSNEAKRAKEQDRKTIAMQKMYADEEARRKADIERARAEKEKLETEYKFLQQDLANETEKSRNLQRRLKDVDNKASVTHTPAVASPLTTPKKSRTLPYRDGFDDDEVLLVSPSRSHVLSRRGTPAVGAKRKRRDTEDNPSQVLLMSGPRSQDPIIGNEDRPGLAANISLLQQLEEEEERFKFTQRLLNHRASDSTERTFEILTKYFLPSTPGKAISSTLLDRFASLVCQKDINYFPADFCLVVISLWLQCLKEEFYNPLYILMDLLKFVLATDTATIAPYVINDLLHVAQLTADINAIPRFRAESAASLNPNINVTECLSLIHLIALGCVFNTEEILHFWKRMRWDFSIMMLKPTQPLEDILIMIRILGTGSLEGSFGPIRSSEVQDQETNEKRLIDPITLLLVESPTTVAGGQLYEDDDMHELRLQILGLFGAICAKQHGGEALAKHPLAIGRLVKLMYDELDALYDHLDGHKESAKIVNLCIRLLYHILTNFTALVDMQAKLAIIHGGSHKYVVGLTRLAFSEGLVLEAGIEDDVIDCAHSLLEDRITLDEGEALLEVFPLRKEI